jgi:hypothetical protein
MSSIGSNHGIFSTHTARTLQAERRQQEPKKSFWDSFGKLTLGQKVGRTVANLGVGGAVGAGAGAGAVYGLGLGLGLATGGIALAGVALGMLGFWGITKLIRHNSEGARVIRECQPRADVNKQSKDTISTIPCSFKTVLGSESRARLNGMIEEHEDLNKLVPKNSDKFDASYYGLSFQFALDMPRGDQLRLQNSDGKKETIIKVKDGKDGEKQNPGTALREFFHSEFPNEPQKAENWAILTSKYANQNAPIALGRLASDVSGLNCSRAKGVGDANSFSLIMEPGGNSAIMECRIADNIDLIFRPHDNVFIAKDKDSDVIDFDRSTMDQTLVLRLHLDPPRSEVLSGMTSYQLAGNENSVPESLEAENLILPEQPASGILSDAGVDSLIRRLDGGSLFEADAQRITQLKSELLEGKRLLEFEKLGIFEKHLFTTPLTPGEKFQLIRLLEGAFDSKGGNAFIDLMSDGKLNEMNPAQIQKLREEIVPSVGVATAYPWSVNNTLASTGAPLVPGERDFDLQNFAHRKLGEKVAREELGVSGEEFYQILKAGLGPSAVMTAGFLDSEKLHPISAELRDELLEDFNRAGTLDEFYAMAETRIQVKKQEAEKVLTRSS